MTQRPDTPPPLSRGDRRAGSLALYEMAERFGGIGHWCWQLGTDEVQWSRQTYVIHGVCPESHCLTLENALAFYHPDDLPQVIRHVEEAIAARSGFRFRARICQPSGAIRHVTSIGEPEMDDEGELVAMFGVFRDDTEQMLAFERVQQAERRLNDAVAALPAGFVLYDADDRLVFCNERYREIYAESADLIVEGACYRDILRGGLERGQYVTATDGEEDWLAERMLDRRRGASDFEIELPGDRWIRVVERTTSDGGRVGFRMDISKLKRQQRELNEARERAEAASEAKSRFLAAMSHEIRTPINGVLGMARALADSIRDERKREMARLIEESGELLLNVLNDALDFSKIEAGRMEIETAAFSMAGIVRQIEPPHSLRASQKDVALTVRLLAPERANRIGDRFRIQQILNNLLSNAIKFTDRGEVLLEIDCSNAAAVQIRVRDSGIGMSERDLARIFEEFAQADSSTSRRFGGTGLGLPIVRGLVEAMSGTLGVESAPGTGTTVSLTLPLPVSEPPKRAPARADAKASLPAGLRVLAAEDNRVNQLVLHSCFAGADIRIVMVDDGQKAVEAFRPGAFDILLLDISMPLMDGTAALAEIRRIEARAGASATPAVAVTAHAMTHQIRAHLEAGFDAHISKPIRRDTLFGTILELLPARDRSRSSA